MKRCTNTGYSIDEHWYPLPHHKQSRPERQLRDPLQSVFSLQNNWDWYNLSQEQILNQQWQQKLYTGEGNKMINIPFIKHHGRVPFSFLGLTCLQSQSSSSFGTQLSTTQNSFLTMERYNKNSPNGQACVKISEIRNCQRGYSLCCLYL